MTFVPFVSRLLPDFFLFNPAVVKVLYKWRCIVLSVIVFFCVCYFSDVFFFVRLFLSHSAVYLFPVNICVNKLFHLISMDSHYLCQRTRQIVQWPQINTNFKRLWLRVMRQETPKCNQMVTSYSGLLRKTFWEINSSQKYIFHNMWPLNNFRGSFLGTLSALWHTVACLSVWQSWCPVAQRAFQAMLVFVYCTTMMSCSRPLP